MDANKTSRPTAQERNVDGGPGRKYRLVKRYSETGAFQEKNEFGGPGRRYGLVKIYA